MIDKFIMVIAAAFVASVHGQAVISDAGSRITDTNITFALSGSDIPSKDQVSKVDPFVRVFTIDGNQKEELLGTTEVAPNTEDPTWLNVFWVKWKQGTGQKLKFVVKDYDILTSNDVIGEATIGLDEYVTKSTTSPDGTTKDITVPIIGGGVLYIRRTYPKSFTLSARNIPHLDNFDGLSDPFVDVYWRKGKNGEDHLVASTAVINDQENPNFPETFEFSNYIPSTEQYLNFRLLDSDYLSGNDDIGEVLVEADPFFRKYEKTTFKVGKSGNATLTVTPAK